MTKFVNLPLRMNNRNIHTRVPESARTRVAHYRTPIDLCLTSRKPAKTNNMTPVAATTHNNSQIILNYLIFDSVSTNSTLFS